MLENSTNKLVYEVKASKVFAFPVPFTSPSDISCYLETDVVGVERKLAAGEFTVESKNDYSAGADITLTIPLPVGKRLAIVRECPITQLTDFPEFGRFPASANEKALDKLTMICQQLYEELSRCVKAGIASGDDPKLIMKAIDAAADTALEAAGLAADAEHGCATILLGMGKIMSDITGDPITAENALKVFAEAAQASAAVKTAVAAGVESINEASIAALEYAEVQLSQVTETAKEAALTETERVYGALNELTGSEGALEAAKKAVAELEANVTEKVDGFDSRVAAAQETVQGIADSVVGYRDAAQEQAIKAAANAALAGDQAAAALKHVADTLANKNSSAESALKAAEEAAKAEIAANAAAGAAGEAATTAAQQSITLHNQRVDAHSNLFNGKADKEHTHTRSDITDLASYLTNLLAGYLSLSGGAMTGSIKGADGADALMLNAATTLAGGAYARLYQSGYADNPGGFALTARDGDTISQLVATAAGAITWRGETLLTQSEAGIRYVRLGNSMQICWGIISDVTAYSTHVITFPKPFSVNPTVVVTPINSPADSVGVNNVNTTKFELITGSVIGRYAWYIGIGYWK